MEGGPVGIKKRLIGLDVPDVSVGPTDPTQSCPSDEMVGAGADGALICGTFKWGFGKYNDIRDDEELAFAWDFKGKATGRRRKRPRRETSCCDDMTTLVPSAARVWRCSGDGSR